MKPEKYLTYAGRVLISGLLWLVLSVPCALAEHDTSLRTDLNLSYTFNDQFRMVAYAFLQVNDEISNMDYGEWGIGLQYQTPVSWLSFLVYYQQGYSKDQESDRQWILEQKPSVNLNLHTTLLGFKWFNQIRYECRMTPEWNDFRIKNTMEISRPDWLLQPCLGWELFYENRDKAVMLNRIKFGINHNFGSHVTAGPYYRMDFSNLNQHWEWTRQLIGFHVTLKY